MAISMNEIIFEQHFKECHGTNSSNRLIQFMWIFLEICDWLALHECLDQHGLTRNLLHNFGKMHIMVPMEEFIKFIQVFLLYSEVQLIRQCLG